MKRLLYIHILVLLVGILFIPSDALAQSKRKKNPEERRVDMDQPTFLPTMKVDKILYEGDSILSMEMNNVYVYPPKDFKDARARAKYDRLVYNVKKVLPIAKEVRLMMYETYEFMMTLPNKRARDQHMKQVEQDVKATYTPRMKKLTLTQGKLLIKLVYRECNSTTFQLVQAFLGPVKAGFYQAFAWVFGASLKKEYDPQGEDREIERVARLVESGQL